MSTQAGLYVSVAGQGWAVALLHGSPTAIRVFDQLASALASEHRVLIPELSGYGRSPPVSSGSPFVRSQEALEDALLALGVREVALVGFSLGGYRAIDLALRGRLRVTSLITIGGFAGLTQAHKDGLRAVAGQVRAMADFTDPGFRKAIAAGMAAPAFAAEHPEAMAQIEGWLDVVSPSVLADELIAATEAPDLGPRLRELAMPSHALVGELDAAVPVAYSKVLAEGIAGASIRVFPGCGHTLMLEDRVGLALAVQAALGTG